LEITFSACLGFLLLRKRGEDQESSARTHGVLLLVLPGPSSATGVPPLLTQRVQDTTPESRFRHHVEVSLLPLARRSSNPPGWGFPSWECPEHGARGKSRARGMCGAASSGSASWQPALHGPPQLEAVFVL